MIVFTATNLKTQDVYVGTARESVEEEWADLLSQADSGASGQFFEQLRDHGSAAFEVETWAYSENAAEARESMREAREDLGAQPIKSNRAQNAGRNTQAIQSASMKALMAVFEEALSNDAPLDDDDLLDGLLPASSRDKTDPRFEDGLEDDEEEAEVVPAAPAKAAVKPAPAVTSAPASTSVASPVAAAAPAPAVAEFKQETVAAVKPAAVSEDKKMVSRMDAMKAAQEKLLREREHKAAAQRIAPGRTASAVSAAPAPAKSDKIASGRTGSAEKERRIRAAIEAERDRREALRHTNTREEQTEMNVVMARIEMRRLAAKKASAEKAKAQAAERRAQAKVEANLAKQALANALRREPVVPPRAVVSPGAEAVAPAPAATMDSRAATAAPSVAAAAAAERGTLKLAAGRTGSGQKEKRIREAIEQEKAQRMAQQQARRAAEAKEMADILARLEERTKAAEKLKRRR